MADHPESDWITDGAPVAEYAGDVVFADITFTTIYEITSLWIVLANGNRYYRTTLRPYGAEDSGPELMAADDQRVRDALAVKILARVYAAVHQLEHAEPALTAADVLRVLDDIGGVVLGAQVAVTSDNIMDAARAAEGN